MKRRVCVTGLAVAGLLAGGCVSPGPVKLSADTYRLSRADSGGRFADAAAMKVAVAAEADAFARSQGKVAVPVAAREETLRVGHLSTIDYDFRLVTPGEPATPPAAPATQSAAPATLSAAPAPQPDVVAGQDKPAVVVAPPAGKPDAKPDLYTELIKLDELRRRGILTEAEFQALKTKLIATM